MSGITPREEEALLALCTMFEKIDSMKILEVVRNNNCDLETCIDELLTVPETLEPAFPIDYDGTASVIEPMDELISELIEETETSMDIPNIGLQIEPSEDLSSSSDDDIDCPLIISQESPVEADDILDKSVPDLDLVTEGRPYLIDSTPILDHIDHPEPSSVELPAEDSKAPEQTDVNPVVPSHDSILKMQDKIKHLDSKLIKKYVKLIEKEFKMNIAKQEKKQKKAVKQEKKELIAKKLHKKFKNAEPREPTSESFDSSFYLPKSHVNFGFEQLDREDQLLQRIADLEAANLRLEEEKKSGMRFMMVQLDGLKQQLGDRDEKIERIEQEMDQLHVVLRESQQQESRLEKLLIHSKEVLVEGVHTLSKNVGGVIEKPWAKIQYEASGFFNIKDESEFRILEKMREFAASLKEEIKGAFKMDASKPTMEMTEEQEVDQEELTPEEQADEEHAKLASLESFAIEEKFRQANIVV